jgi:tetratricopeptide (TPR) repeat protein
MNYRENMLILAFEQFEQIKGPATDERWGTALKICAAGDLNGAARLVNELVSQVQYTPIETIKRSGMKSQSLDHLIYELVIGTLSNLSVLKNGFSSDVVEMLCKAADSGFPEAAYNAANGLTANAKTQAEYQRAESYFKIAIDTTPDNIKRAAAIVNYAALVRDGLVTGRKDHLGAIKLYEEAAEQGLLTAMYNTANVSMWEVKTGNTALIEKAAFWYKKVVEYHDSGAPLHEMDKPKFISDSIEQSIKHLADFHINGKIKGYNLEFGIGMARRITVRDSDDSILKNWLLEIGLSKRLMTLSAPLSSSSSDNWHYLLSNLDWNLGPITRGAPRNPFDTFVINHERGKALMVVLDYLFEPGKRYRALDGLVSKMFADQVEHVFVVSAIGMFQMNEDTVHVPVILYARDALAVATFTPRMSPEDIIENTLVKGLFFQDKGLGAHNCIFPIALNMLNSGKKISDGLNVNARYAVMEDVCIPDLAQHVKVSFMQHD